MKKIITISGMNCEHCRAKVEKALNSVRGVEAKVDLQKKLAVAKVEGEIADQVLIDAVSEAGFEVLSISEKKGLFER